MRQLSIFELFSCSVFHCSIFFVQFNCSIFSMSHFSGKSPQGPWTYFFRRWARSTSWSIWWPSPTLQTDSGFFFFFLVGKNDFSPHAPAVHGQVAAVYRFHPPFHWRGQCGCVRDWFFCSKETPRILNSLDLNSSVCEAVMYMFRSFQGTGVNISILHQGGLCSPFCTGGRHVPQTKW